MSHILTVQGDEHSDDTGGSVGRYPDAGYVEQLSHEGGPRQAVTGLEEV